MPGLYSLKEFKIEDDRWLRIRNYHLRRFKEALKSGLVDDGIIPLLETVNKHPDFVSRSSCYGRILLLREYGIPKKGRDVIIGKYHHPIDMDTIKHAIKGISDYTLWMNIEGTIVHIATNSLINAEKLLEIAYKSGYNYSTIYSISDRGVTIELLERRKVSVLLGDGKYGYFINDKALKKLYNYIIGMFREIDRKINTFITLFKDDFTD